MTTVDVQIPVEFSERLCRSLDLDSLPDNWSDNPAPDWTRSAGELLTQLGSMRA